MTGTWASRPVVMVQQDDATSSDTKSAQQSYKDAAALVLHAFSCVAYIRWANAVPAH